MRRRVLIVEDDPLQQALLREAFESRGFEIETADDGLTAVSRLKSGTYDAALIDFCLPEIDGLQSAKILHELLDDAARPNLIAMSSDAEELRTHEASSRVFESILPKPFDVASVVNIVEQSVARDRDCTAFAEQWRDVGLANPPAAMAVPTPTRAQLSALRNYFDFSGSRATEVVLLCSSEGIEELEYFRLNAEVGTLPFVDLTGRYGDVADASFTASRREDWMAVANAIVRFSEARLQLSVDVLHSREPELRLLAYIFQSGRRFEPRHDPSDENCVRYPGFVPTKDVRTLAEELARKRMLERTFIDRFHECGSCGSFRMNVREECPACRSADLKSVALIHHYPCAHQAAETDFVSGRSLVCPKCRGQLRHYGSDYDKPGEVSVCRSCELTNSEPAVGFVCLDCNAHTVGEAAQRKDVFGYRLTDKGVGEIRLSTGAAMLPAPNGSKRGSYLPEELELELELEWRRSSTDGSAPVCVAEFRYQNEATILESSGEEVFKKQRAIFVQNVCATLDCKTSVFDTPKRDFVLAYCSEDDFEDLIDRRAIRKAQAVLPMPLDARMRILDPAFLVPNE